MTYKIFRMRYKYYASFYKKYDAIPKDWYCVALFNDAPEHLKKQRNFLNNSSSFFSPSKELIETYHKNNNVIDDSLEEDYLKEVISNFQKWKRVNDGYFKSSINTFLDWLKYLDETFDNYGEDWKGIIFMTNEEKLENSFRKSFIKLMRHNKILVYELNDELFKEKKDSQQKQKIKKLF